MPLVFSLGVPYLGSSELVVTIGVDDVVKPCLYWPLVFLADHCAVIGTFLVGESTQCIIEIGGLADGAAGFLDKVIVHPFPESMASQKTADLLCLALIWPEINLRLLVRNTVLVLLTRLWLIKKCKSDKAAIILLFI